jgi:hypothetical protein
MRRNWLRALAAVLLGNAIYLLALPRLPRAMRHVPFHADLGMVLDFLLCMLFFLLMLRFDRR